MYSAIPVVGVERLAIEPLVAGVRMSHSIGFAPAPATADWIGVERVGRVAARRVRVTGVVPGAGDEVQAVAQVDAGLGDRVRARAARTRADGDVAPARVRSVVPRVQLTGARAHERERVAEARRVHLHRARRRDLGLVLPEVAAERTDETGEVVVDQRREVVGGVADGVEVDPQDRARVRVLGEVAEGDATAHPCWCCRLARRRACWSPGRAPARWSRDSPRIAAGPRTRSRRCHPLASRVRREIMPELVSSAVSAPASPTRGSLDAT